MAEHQIEVFEASSLFDEYQGVEYRDSFSPDLIKHLIKRLTKEGETVFDPFCGIGTACALAMSLGRHAIGWEQDPDRFKISVERCGGSAIKRIDTLTVREGKFPVSDLLITSPPFSALAMRSSRPEECFVTYAHSICRLFQNSRAQAHLCVELAEVEEAKCVGSIVGWWKAFIEQRFRFEKSIRLVSRQRSSVGMGIEMLVFKHT